MAPDEGNEAAFMAGGTNPADRRDRLRALFTTMARIRAFEDAAEIASQGGVSGLGPRSLRHAGAGARPAAPVHRAGSRGHRRLRQPAPRRPAHVDPSRPRPHAGQGRRHRPAMMCELFGRATGTNGGKGGCMHIADFSVGMLGANGVVAAGIPIATGAAHALKIARSDRHRRLLLRRRRDQPRAVPRRPELGAGLPAAGAVRLRGQPDRGHHAHAHDDRRRRRRRARRGARPRRR